MLLNKNLQIEKLSIKLQAYLQDMQPQATG